MNQLAIDAAAQAIFKLRHPAPGWMFNPHTDHWAVEYAEAAIAAYEEANR